MMKGYISKWDHTQLEVSASLLKGARSGSKFFPLRVAPLLPFVTREITFVTSCLLSSTPIPFWKWCLIYKESFCSKVALAQFWKRVYSEKEKFAPLLEEAPFQKGWCAGEQTESHKSCLVCKNGRKTTSTVISTAPATGHMIHRTLLLQLTSQASQKWPLNFPLIC